MEAAHFFQATNDEYQADPRLSRSALRCAAKSLAQFYERYEARTVPPDETDPQRLGTMIHSAVLHPRFFEGSFTCIPAGVLAADGSKSGRAWKAWLAQQPTDQLLLKIREYQQLERIVKKVRTHKTLGPLLAADGQYEQNIAFDPFLFGGEPLQCRARIDKLIPGRYILDLKSTSKPLDYPTIANEAAKYGWGEQAAFYQEAVRLATGYQRLPMVFGVIQTVEPYECAAVDLPASWLENGSRRLYRAAEKIIRARSTGNWGRPDDGMIVTLAEPSWSARDEDWELQNGDAAG